MKREKSLDNASRYGVVKNNARFIGILTLFASSLADATAIFARPTIAHEPAGPSPVLRAVLDVAALGYSIHMMNSIDRYSQADIQAYEDAQKELVVPDVFELNRKKIVERMVTDMEHFAVNADRSLGFDMATPTSIAQELTPVHAALDGILE